jgi:methyl-accepting chemotaxis protein
VLDAVIGPLHMATSYVDRISKGDIPAKITDNYSGDFNEIKNNLNTCIDAVNRMIEDANLLSKAAVEGRLKTRADASRHQGDFRRIIQGVNDTLDAVISPLNVAATYVDRISKGDIPRKIADNYSGDFNELKSNLNTCIDAVNRMIEDANALSKAAVEGRLKTRAVATRHQGDFRKIIQGVNDTLDAVIGPLRVAATYVDRISKGDIPPKIVDNYNGDFNEIKNSLNTCIDAVNAMIDDANLLSKAAVEGRLKTRADSSRHHGDFRRIIQGVNDTLDAVIGPLNVAATYVDRISKGDIPRKIAENYNGDFNEIKNNLNTCIDAVNRMSEDANMLTKAAVEGRLGTRADAARHQGDFRKIIQGVNDTLDAVIGPLNALIDDADMLAKAALEGRLETRADAEKHDFDFRRAVEGINSLLDAVVAPIAEASVVLEQLAQRNLSVRVKGNYKGDHAKIKDSINASITALQDALGQVCEAVDQVAAGSGQIASSSQAVAQGASEQASSLEQVSGSLEEMLGMTRQNADNTRHAKTLAQQTKSAADKGFESMAKMVDAMGKIRAAAEGTAEIIRDINEISFQTNLLALNAAVEAARAGDAGRGFAVVAEEVRNLALRSKDAAKKTEDLIKQSVLLADSGQIMSKEVNGNLLEIVESVGKVTGIIGEITEASQEQARGIDTVNEAMQQMEKVTQQNAANSEQSSSAAEELSSQAEELAAMIGTFELARDTR